MYDAFCEMIVPCGWRVGVRRAPRDGQGEGLEDYGDATPTGRGTDALGASGSEEEEEEEDDGSAAGTGAAGGGEATGLLRKRRAGSEDASGGDEGGGGKAAKAAAAAAGKAAKGSGAAGSWNAGLGLRMWLMVPPMLYYALVALLLAWTLVFGAAGK